MEREIPMASASSPQPKFSDFFRFSSLFFILTLFSHFFLALCERCGNVVDMIRKQTTKNKAGSGTRVWRHGMGAMAEQLGVSRTHLWFVVTGARRSPRIEGDAGFRAWMRGLAKQGIAK